MKKWILLFVLQFLCVYGFTQQTTYLNEGFATVPPTGWTIDAQASHWTAVASANAGGTSKECQFDYNPSFTGASRLISPSLNLTGVTTLYLSFKHAISHYTTPYTVGVATRANGGAWHDVWTLAPTANVGASNVFININNGDQSSSAFQVCFYFNGNSYNINDWWIDDVVLYQPYAVDGAITSITSPSYAGQGSMNITGVAKNMGSTNITSMVVNYKIGSGATQTTTLSSLNIAPGGTYNYTCTQPWAATPGSYLVASWVSAVNGAADLCPANDTSKKTICIASQTVSRLALYEEFTSSTCAPCASFNSSTFTPFINSHLNQFSLVKYQMNWPGSGDPYYTAEGGVRRTYYGVSGVPDLYIDGMPSAMSTGGMGAELTAEQLKPTFFQIYIAPTYTGNNITIPVAIAPYLTGTFKLYVIIIEKTTTGNVGTNGETSWHNVMMKMLPGGSGTNVTFTDGTTYTNTFTYTSAKADNIEEMSDLQAVVFIQENATKEVFQSVFADIQLSTGVDRISEENIAIYPNPAADNVNILNAQNADLMVYDMYGKLITSVNQISNNYILNVSDLATGTYIIRLISGDQVISKKINVLK